MRVPSKEDSTPREEQLGTLGAPLSRGALSSHGQENEEDDDDEHYQIEAAPAETPMSESKQFETKEGQTHGTESITG